VALEVLIKVTKEKRNETIWPTGKTVQMAEVVTRPPIEAEAEPTTPIQMLPATTSNLPLIGLLGLMALAAAFAVRATAVCLQ
jgi:hypothetical protein